MALTTVLAFLLNGLLEGIGIAFVLPLLALVLDRASAATSESTQIEVLVQQLLDTAGLPATLEVILGLLVGIMLAKIAVGIGAAFVVADASARIGADVRRRMVRALAAAEWNYFVRLAGGVAATAMGTEVQRGQNAFVGSAKLVAAVVRVGAMLALALVISWTVTIASLVFGGTLILLLSFLIRLTAEAGRRQTGLQSSLNSRLIDGLASMKPVKAMAREHTLVNVLNRDINLLEQTRRRLTFLLSAITPLVEPLTMIALAVGLLVLLGPGQMRLESVVVLALLFTRSVGGIASMQTGYQTIVSNAAGFWYVEDLIREAEASREELQGAGFSPLAHSIRFEGVSFAHAIKGGRPILRDASFEIPAYQFTLITGASGAGKTSLIDLLLAFYRPTEGRILLDGRDLAEIDRTAWRARVGYVSQEILLLNDTVRNNVTLGDTAITMEQVDEALGLAGAAAFVGALPQQLETVVGERGSLLSGGQRQRIALARALVNKPDLLVLDEVTTSLDATTARQVLADLSGLKGRMTIVAISHQVELAEVADQVLQIEDGSVHQVVPRARRIPASSG